MCSKSPLKIEKLWLRTEKPSLVEFFGLDGVRVDLFYTVQSFDAVFSSAIAGRWDVGFLERVKLNSLLVLCWLFVGMFEGIILEFRFYHCTKH